MRSLPCCRVHRRGCLHGMPGYIKATKWTLACHEGMNFVFQGHCVTVPRCSSLTWALSDRMFDLYVEGQAMEPSNWPILSRTS